MIRYSAALDQGIIKLPASKQAKSPSHDIITHIYVAEVLMVFR